MGMEPRKKERNRGLLLGKKSGRRGTMVRGIFGGKRGGLFEGFIAVEVIITEKGGREVGETFKEFDWIGVRRETQQHN